MSPSAWLVDLDGTLYAPRPLKFAMGFELLLFGLPHLGRIRAFRREHEAIRREGPDCDGDPFALQLARAARGLGCEVDELEGVVREWMIRRPCRWLPHFCNRGLLKEIAEFRAAGGRTALVSDYPAREKLRALGASELFDVIVASGESGGPPALKPSPAGFLIAAKALNVPPEQCLVLGDRQDSDGEAAGRAGMAFRKV